MNRKMCSIGVENRIKNRDYSADCKQFVIFRSNREHIRQKTRYKFPYKSISRRQAPSHPILDISIRNIFPLPSIALDKRKELPKRNRHIFHIINNSLASRCGIFLFLFRRKNFLFLHSFFIFHQWRHNVAQTVVRHRIMFASTSTV